MAQFAPPQVAQFHRNTHLSQIDGLIENRLKSFTLKPSTPSDAEEFLTREEVAKLFKISLVTLGEWNKKGVLNPLRVGRFVRFRKSEIMSTPKAINASVEGLQA